MTDLTTHRDQAIEALAHVTCWAVNNYVPPPGEPMDAARYYAEHIVDIATKMLEVCDPRSVMNEFQALYDRMVE